jgi:hypothetical protein
VLGLPREMEKTHFNILNPYDRIEKISSKDKSSKISSGGNGSKMLSKNISMTFYDDRRLSNNAASKLYS